MSDVKEARRFLRAAADRLLHPEQPCSAGEGQLNRALDSTISAVQALADIVEAEQPQAIGDFVPDEVGEVDTTPCQQLVALRAELTALRKDHRGLEKLALSRAAESGRRQVEIERLQKQCDEHEDRADAAEHRVGDLESEIERLQEEYDRLAQLCERQRKEIARLQEQRDAAWAENARLLDQRNELAAAVRRAHARAKAMLAGEDGDA